MEIRRNESMCNAVVQGMLVDANKGSVAAWAFMARQSVPLNVIMRILGEPLKRRPTDPIIAFGFMHGRFLGVRFKNPAIGDQMGCSDAG